MRWMPLSPGESATTGLVGVVIDLTNDKYERLIRKMAKSGYTLLLGLHFKKRFSNTLRE
jgi:hypothetical protein